MRIWATGTSNSNPFHRTGIQRPCSALCIRPRGFTLLEVLVVVLIVGIVVGLLVPAFTGTARRDLETEAQRLAALLRLASEEAVLQGQEYAVELAPDGYRFLALGSGGWQPVQDPLLRPRELPASLRLEVFYEGERFDFFLHREQAPTAAQETLPRLYILSSGEMTPLEILLSDTEGDAGNYRIQVELHGRIRLEG